MSNRKVTKDHLLRELAAVRGAHAQLLALLKAAPGYVGLTQGPEHTFTFVNDALSRWAGDTELVGASFRAGLPQFADRLAHGLLDSVYGGGEPLFGAGISLSSDLEDQDSRERLIDLAMMPLSDVDGYVTGVASFAVDVTDKVHAERRLSLMMSELRQLEALNAALREENAKLRLEARQSDAQLQRSQIDGRKQTDAMRVAVMDVISQELRTPAHVLLGYGNILARELDGLLTPTQNGYLNKMLGSADVLADLLNDILAYGQLKSGAFTLSKGLVNFTDVLDEAVAKYQPSMVRKGLKLTTHRAQDVALLMGDEQRLSQVVSKILDNAVKFTPAGGEISVSVRREAGHLLCEIADTGVGIPEETLSGLFEPYSDLETVLTRSARGCGMGLTLSKAYTEAHGGRLEVSSTQGSGTMLRVTFPLLDSEPEEAHSESRAD